MLSLFQSIEFGRLAVYDGDSEEALAICGNPKAQAGYPVALLRVHDEKFWFRLVLWYVGYSTSVCLECFDNRAQLPHSPGKEIENNQN